MCKPINVFLLIVSAIMMYLLFVASPMELEFCMKQKVENLIQGKKTELNESCNNKEYSCEEFFNGLHIELQKANTEIQERLNHETEWFKLKYQVVGALLLGFILNAYLKNDNNANSDQGQDQVQDENIPKQFNNAIHSPITSLVLSLTVIVAVSIDMQIRAGRIVINQLGIWISYYAEPMLLGTTNQGGLGWEQFLRGYNSYHTNNLFTLTFWTDIYYLSIILYVLYLTVSRLAMQVLQTDNQKQIIWFGFWILHITLLISSLSDHIVPFQFRVTLFPILTGWTGDYSYHPGWLVPIYFLWSSFLTLIAYYYIKKS